MQSNYERELIENLQKDNKILKNAKESEIRKNSIATNKL